MSLFGKNIKKIRSVKSLSQQAFADIFDLKRGTLGAYEEGRSEPKIETIIKIANYFSITIDAILTKELTVNQLFKFRGELEGNHDMVIKKKFTEIPCITFEDHNNYIKLASNTNFINDLTPITLPINSDKKLRAFVVNNLEMSSENNGLFPKDIVIGEWTSKNDYEKITRPDVFLILTKEALLLKRIFASNNEFILRADHAGIDESILPYSEIIELWHIKYVFHNRVPDIKNSQVLNKLAFLENEFKKLKDSL
ncbi:helix-turn-helix domain-containing protein [Tamlana agarivorans]|uniref:Helix-turn-helix domain-containing protein n=1 Tax=Pseudotamlana agarivorans TaxID=481183 RepID=A0ACC5U7U2_9FLAO|nr:helix-turn-helix transcriptional regulator [Tamlana agarivorans]MBU2950391.1 helix-turn-helix domain-containing protein [Tamlana agarivorans]